MDSFKHIFAGTFPKFHEQTYSKPPHRHVPKTGNITSNA